MAKKKAGTKKAPTSAVRRAVQGIRMAKEEASGRLWDELHNAESRILRAHEGRKSTFNRAHRRRTASQGGGQKKSKK